jgi:hypothetical protein
MKHKIKTALAKLLLVLVLTAFDNGDLNAQPRTTFTYDRRFHEPLFKTPSARPTIWQSPSSPLGFHRKDNVPFPSNPQIAGIPRSTRPHTREEWGLLNFNPSYLAAYASRLEKSSGVSLETLVADRDQLLSKAKELEHDLSEARGGASGPTKHIDIPAYTRLIKNLDNAVYALHLEREAFVKEAYATYNQLFNKKKPVLDKLVTNLNKKLQDESYTDDTIEDLNKHYAELKSLSERIKTNSELLFRAPGTNPDYIAAQNACNALRSTIDARESDFKNNLELYNQKKTVLDSLLADLNKKVEDESISEEDYENLNAAHGELSLLFEKTKILGSFFGQDPKKHADYIAAEKMLTAAQKHIEESHQFYENRKYGEILEFEADTPHIAQELNNFNSIFLGEQAPDMEAFNNLMSAFMGKKGSTGGGTSPNSIPLDPSMQGDYILSSFKYQDDKADVYMEIARVIKINECQVPLSKDGISWDEIPEGYLDLSSINVSQETREVTFALFGQGEKILLQTDINSMSNYVAQRNIEGIVYFDPTAANRIPVDLDKIPTHGLKNFEPTFARQTASVVMDFLPLIGTTKSISELIFGYDHISGEQVHRVVAGFGVVASFVPIPGAAKAGKWIGKGIAIGAELLTKKTNGVSVIEKNFARLVSHIPREMPEVLKKLKPQYEAVKAFTEAGYKGGAKYYALLEDKILHAGDMIKRLKPDVQEQLKHLRIPEKPLVPGGGLLKHEIYVDSHTIEKHVGKSIEYLKERWAKAANSFKKPDGFSTFNNLEEAEYFVSETIKKNKDEISEWLKTAKRSRRFELPFNKSTGKLLKEGATSVIDVQKVRIILLPSKDVPEGYRILTAFPVQ